MVVHEPKNSRSCTGLFRNEVPQRTGRPRGGERKAHHAANWRPTSNSSCTVTGAPQKSQADGDDAGDPPWHPVRHVGYEHWSEAQQLKDTCRCRQREHSLRTGRQGHAQVCCVRPRRHLAVVLELERAQRATRPTARLKMGDQGCAEGKEIGGGQNGLAHPRARTPR